MSLATIDTAFPRTSAVSPVSPVRPAPAETVTAAAPAPASTESAPRIRAVPEGTARRAAQPASGQDRGTPHSVARLSRSDRATTMSA